MEQKQLKSGEDLMGKKSEALCASLRCQHGCLMGRKLSEQNACSGVAYPGKANGPVHRA